MATMTQARRTEIESRVTELEKLIAANYASMEQGLETGGVESFKFDSGDASQWARFRTAEDMLKSMDILWKQVDFWNRKLNGTSNTYIMLRRKQVTISRAFAV